MQQTLFAVCNAKFYSSLFVGSNTQKSSRCLKQREILSVHRIL